MEERTFHIEPVVMWISVFKRAVDWVVSIFLMAIAMTLLMMLMVIAMFIVT